ncbi:MAG: flagellar hook basal-body protein [Planctomycetaceae bacterium]
MYKQKTWIDWAILGAGCCALLGFVIAGLLQGQEAPSPSPFLLTSDESELPVPPPQDLGSKSRVTPGTIGNQEEAIPLKGDAISEQQMIRKFIEQDLKDASKQEQDIWFEYLKNESPGLARNLLDLRKRFGSSILGLDSSLDPASPAESIESDSASSKPIQSRSSNDYSAIDLESEELNELKMLWSTVRKMALFNVGQLHLPGYKRLDFISTTPPTDLPQTELDLNNHLPTGTYRLDLSQGELEETGRTFDIAIKGTGWFQLTDPNTKANLYTRNGRFSLSAEGNFCLQVGDHQFNLNPKVSIPFDVNEIEISDTGVVSIPGGELGSKLGQIQIARFPNAAALSYLGEGLYASTQRCGVPILGNPLTGMLQQGCLELANVDEESELSQLDRYYRQWQTGLKLMTDYPLIPGE